MAAPGTSTLCILGTGNLGLAILKSVISPRTVSPSTGSALPFEQYIACVRTSAGEQRVRAALGDNTNVTISRGDNVAAVHASQVVVLGVDPADVEAVLSQPGLADALAGKLVISVAAGWTRSGLEYCIRTKQKNHFPGGSAGTAHVIRILPNIAALVGESITAVEEPATTTPASHLELTQSIFSRIGKTTLIPEKLMPAVTAVSGSTPAFFSIICDALIDAAVAVGVPRGMAREMVVQSMKGSAKMMSNPEDGGGGLSPAELRDQGTSPEGCTIAGVMVIEEAGVRGHVGKALREAVTVARMMGRVEHVNDTR
ncbi:pyrroline-5-carboxylate reductase dimerization-domain-containing protein [Microdochium bolleyi]|uniref:Pyrroline-5-carboxylate reductase dimerization-domain-containing protein n=1 Tax=Microdochium bolleyi TaxID=196109 RepID=A0A136IL15_9PEZI|nr:pyrroline-5-carboxylate reductase dimerization-domain-containing protein [Microdochium bolleyi]